MSKKLIPFSRELYEKGYKAVTKDGHKVKAIFFDENTPEDWPSGIYVYENPGKGHWSRSFNADGSSYNGKNEEDLLLEAKTIDLWIGLSTVSYQDTYDAKRYPTTAAYTHITNVYNHPLNTNNSSILKLIKITVDAETLEQV